MKHMKALQTRWRHRPKHPEFIALDEGEIVIARAFHPRVSYRLNNEKRSIQNLVRVERFTKKKGEKDIGLISVMYLEPISATGLPKTAIGRQIMSVNDVPREILEAKWFAGRMNPIEVGIVLRCEPQHSFGSYLVCQPSEIIPHSARWPDYLLVVKCITGSEAEYYREWEVNYNYNVTYAMTSAYPARIIKNDTMPGTKQPSPTVAFIRIRRTNTGRFYMFDTDKETFYTIYQLIDYYTEQKLTLDMASAIALRRPAELHSEPTSGPRPIEMPIPPRQYKMPKNECGLITVPDRRDISYTFGRRSDTENDTVPSAGNFCKVLLCAEGEYCVAALRRLKDSMVKQSNLIKDLNLLFLDRRKYNENLDQKNRNVYFIQGEEYLCKIVGFNVDDQVRGPWVAYEFVNGNPLDTVLMMRKEDGLPPLTIRANFEIVYQIAAGMRHLEDNGLCHRSLRASNILVAVEHEFALSVRITDYMLPYHALNTTNKEIDLNELSWKWMGMDSLDKRVFNIKADVWSFGCVMFEIFNPGQQPYSYEETPIDSPKSLLNFLRQGRRMTIQKEDDGRIPNFLQSLMACCWHKDPGQRPTFARIFTFLYDLLFDFANGCNKAICEYQTEKGGLGTTGNILTVNVGAQKKA